MTKLEQAIDEINALAKKERELIFYPNRDIIKAAGIINAQQLRIKQLEGLLLDVIKDYQGLETAAENNNLIRTASDARDTIAHIINILNTKPVKPNPPNNKE